MPWDGSCLVLIILETDVAQWRSPLENERPGVQFIWSGYFHPPNLVCVSLPVLHNIFFQKKSANEKKKKNVGRAGRTGVFFLASRFFCSCFFFFKLSLFHVCKTSVLLLLQTWNLSFHRKICNKVAEFDRHVVFHLSRTYTKVLLESAILQT